MTLTREFLPQLLLALFLAGLLALARAIGLSLPMLLGDALVRLVMNGVLVLSLVPMLNAGLGINFGMPVGICAGLLGACLALQLRLSGLAGLLAALALAVPPALLLGAGYSRLLNRVPGREEITGTFLGFAFVALMNIFWAVAPFTNPAMLWPIGGKGLRPSIGLGGSLAGSLNRLWEFRAGGLRVPAGMLLAFALLGAAVTLFFRTRAGLALKAVGENPRFAALSGVRIDRARTLAVILSTVLAAWGIVVYAQSYGFLELYSAPLMMAFPAASAIFMGGSSGRRASLLQVAVGTFLFQTLFSVSGPVANGLLLPQAAEILRVLLVNGVILYTLLAAGGRSRARA
jgi:simple sugar transport system permease protein